MSKPCPLTVRTGAVYGSACAPPLTTRQPADFTQLEAEGEGGTSQKAAASSSSSPRQQTGFIRRRGLMIMAIFGNVVTSFSWFGVNMLGVGLHSYGFMQKAFPWLVGFIISQLALMCVAAMPLERWRSFRTGPATTRSTKPPVDFAPPELAVEATSKQSI